MGLYKLELRFFTLESSSVAPCLFAAGTLNRFIGVSHRAHSQSHLQYTLICISKLITLYIYIYIRIRGLCPLKLVNFLCELMYYYWKISYFGNFLYTAPGQPGGGGPRLYQGGAGPPGPTVATALISVLGFETYYV